jgi:Matrixin
VSKVSKVSKIVAVGLLGASLAVLEPPALAWAANAGSTTCSGAPRSCISLSWYTGGLYRMLIHPSVGYNMTVELEWVMANAYPSSTTHLEMSRTYSSGAWEVRAATTSSPSTGIVGWVECKPGVTTSGSHPNQRCSYENLWFNTVYLDTTNGDSNYLAAIACHEMGHTVGLRHSADTASCLQNPPIAYQWYPTSHDRGELAARYTR